MMGQSSSISQSNLPISYRGTGSGDMSHMQTRLQAQLTILRSLAKVSHKEVLECIEELNNVTRSFTDRSGKQLWFVVRSGSDTTFLWKATIRIGCLKINTNAGTIESQRQLNLRQFVVIYKEITEQVAALSKPVQRLDQVSNQAQGQASGSGVCQSKEEEFTASAFFPTDPEKLKEDIPTEKKDASSKAQEAEEGECCVCMDRKACIMLSCCHEFCEICIDMWTRDDSHSTCPLCRKKVEGSNDTWVLTDQQDPDDYECEVRGYLLGLADRSGRPEQQSEEEEEEAVIIQDRELPEEEDIPQARSSVVDDIESSDGDG